MSLTFFVYYGNKPFLLWDKNLKYIELLIPSKISKSYVVLMEKFINIPNHTSLLSTFQASLVCDDFEHVRAIPREASTNNILDSSFSTNGGFEDFDQPNGANNGSSLHNTSIEVGGESSQNANGSGVRSSSAVRKGLLWQQRDKIFSQWKERYFILTPDYLQCFKKGTSRITEMGEFICKVHI